MQAEGKPILDIRGVSKSFGGIHAVQDCSLAVNQGSIVGLIGPNGSGKTTLFNLLTGVDSIDSGKIYFKGEEISHLRTFEIARRGLCRTFQEMRLFWKLSAFDNLVAAGLEWLSPSAEDRAIEVLSFIGLQELMYKPASEFSFGQQRLLQLGIVLMGGANLILLDEPTSGVNPKMIDGLLQYIKEIREKEQKTFFVVEHNMYVIMSICDYVYVLDEGQKIAEGIPNEIEKNDKVIAAYFGKKK